MDESEGSLTAATEWAPNGTSNGTGVVDTMSLSGAGCVAAAAAAAAVDFLFFLPVLCRAGSC